MDDKNDPKLASLEQIRLSNGVKIPAVGFGCAFGNWTVDGGFMGFTPEDAWSAIPKALNAGLRHFDAAYVYRTHRHLGTIIGQKMRDGSVKREDLFITTKIFHPEVAGFTAGKTIDMDAAMADGSVKDVLTGHFFESLDELGLGYVDLLLVHWPGKPASDVKATSGADGAAAPQDKDANRRLRKQVWETVEAMHKCGKARAIGVSNWTEVHIADLLADGASVKPHVNQIEMSPYTIYPGIVKFCQENDIVIEAYSPMGSDAGAVRKDPVMVELAQKYKKNEGQVILRWLVQQGIVVLPRSSSEERMRTNADIFGFEIDEADMAKISALNKGKSFTNNNPYDIL